MTKKPPEIKEYKTTQEVKDAFEKGELLYVLGGYRDPAPFKELQSKQTEEQKAGYKEIWKSLEGGKVKKTKDGIRVESKKVRKSDGEFEPTVYHDFIPIDTTPSIEDISSVEVRAVGGSEGSAVRFAIPSM